MNPVSGKEMFLNFMPSKYTVDSADKQSFIGTDRHCLPPWDIMRGNRSCKSDPGREGGRRALFKELSPPLLPLPWQQPTSPPYVSV